MTLLGIHPGDPAFPLPPAAGSPILTHPGSLRPHQEAASSWEEHLLFLHLFFLELGWEGLQTPGILQATPPTPWLT